MTFFALFGVLLLGRRYPRPTRYIGFLIALQLAAVFLSGAQGLSQQLVLARYMLLSLPFLLFAAAVGLAGCAERLLPYPAAAAASIAALMLLLFFSGPLPSALGRPNAFFEHQMYFMDFDPAHNPEIPYLRAGPIPSFYRELGKLPPRSKVIIEAPWRFESIFNRLPVFQEIHHQRVEIGMVGGLCPPGASLEQPRFFRNKFRHFIDLSRPAGELRRAGDYVVFHRTLDMANMTERWQTYDGKGLPPVGECIERFRKTFGDPVFEDETVTVFALGK
jgi:hypothetical protein